MDLLQDIFLKVYLKLASFREEAEVKTWLYRISYNHAISWIRKQRLRRMWSFLPGREPSSTVEPTALDEVLHDEAQALANQAINALPPRQRAALHLRITDNQPYHQIAEIMGTSVGTAKANVFHAIKRLQQELGGITNELQRNGSAAV